MALDDIPGARPKKWFEGQVRDHLKTEDIDGATNHRLTRLPVDKFYDDYGDVTREVGSYNLGISPKVHKWRLDEIYGISPPFKYSAPLGKS